MASSSTTVYFVTGCNRGIGLAVTQQLAARPNTLVFATARDPSRADKLQQLAKQHSNVRIVQLAVTSDEEHTAAARLVEAEAGRVDVVLANAGICQNEAMVPTERMTVEAIREHHEVNTLGPVRLFTAFYPLLTRSADPKFVVVSTAAGSIGYASKASGLLAAQYGSSKAAVNFLVRRIAVEHADLTAFPLHPGLVATEMGEFGARQMGLEQLLISTEESARRVLQLLDESTRETHSGRFWNADDQKELPW